MRSFEGSLCVLLPLWLSLYVVLRRGCYQVDRYLRPFSGAKCSVGVVDGVHCGNERSAHLRGHGAMQHERVELISNPRIGSDCFQV